jgi:hypothetical protein
MIDWQPKDTAPMDGSPVLLWARPWAHPHEPESFSAVVGYWHKFLTRWKARGTDEDLFVEKWAPLEQSPGAEGQP